MVSSNNPGPTYPKTPLQGVISLKLLICSCLSSYQSISFLIALPNHPSHLPPQDSEIDGMFLIEVDRVLKPGGYFVLTSPTSKPRGSSSSTKKGSVLTPIEELTQRICWSLLAQQDETLIWQKTMDVHCYTSRPSYHVSVGPPANAGFLFRTGVHPDDYFEDSEFWRSSLRNYWSLLTPLIFSDHPKRPGDEDPLPPFNMIRNVMDMNARYGGLNAAFLEAKRSVWVMNVVPTRTQNTLPLILYQGFAGVLHDWCEPFPTYPRTYDMLHANGLLSHLTSEGCNIMNLLLEMDRILRPEGWVVLSDNMVAIEKARALATQIRWEARVIDLQKGTDQRLLVCQKPFLKK
ncbi:putative methyltransferase PMT4 [Vitis vinifera]|uniref:Methyltransferase n=1 Tax=Vitis vinifera TaxID=29760 RepID=A0A438E328_VITVI|nr:putative methyltransferase PMT4 [Vitis vinifera]